ncbi:MAG: tetratricopeptide repeat protein [Pseudomonadota bacterium]
MMAAMMPTLRFPLRLAALAAAFLCPVPPALAQSPSPVPAPSAATAPAAATDSASPVVSALSAELFYQLLLGELNARGADPGAGFSMVLDAARRTNDPALYQRAVEIALQNRAGEPALQAAQAWRQAYPGSRDANRYLLQILLALNRIAETADALKAEINLAAPSERNAAISAVPRMYARASDKKLAATLVQQALADALARPDTAASAWTAVGRMRLAAGEGPAAIDAARRAQAAAPASEGPALLALELMAPGQPEAEVLVRRYLESPMALPEMRMAYARALLQAQRYPDASQQLKTITERRADFAEAWLVQGVLQTQDNQLDAADASLKRYLDLAAAQPPGDERSRGQSQAYLALAQIAEKRKDLPLATAWLDKIENARDLVSAQTRRASILAQQGRMDEARRLVRQLPERTPEDTRMKLTAEVQLLRDNKQYRVAYDLLEQAIEKAPQDAELLYDQAMLAEKLNELAAMERLLRRAIAAKPDFHHAYNALGYSLADRNLRLPEARQLVSKALELAPGDPFITDSLAWVEFRAGNRTEALRLLEQAYKARPDAEIAAHLGEVLWSLGQRERATAIWREGLLLNRDNETLQETLKRLQVKL